MDILDMRFPSQLFEAGAMLVILGFLVVHIRKDHVFFGQSILLYAAVIFVSEYFIDQPEITRMFSMSSVQVGAFVLAAVSLYEIRKRNAENAWKAG